MIRSVTTLLLGVAVAVLIVISAMLAAVYVIGLAAKVTLFGEPKTTLAMQIFKRIKWGQ